MKEKPEYWVGVVNDDIYIKFFNYIDLNYNNPKNRKLYYCYDVFGDIDDTTGKPCPSLHVHNNFFYFKDDLAIAKSFSPDLYFNIIKTINNYFKKNPKITSEWYSEVYDNIKKNKI